MRNLVIAFALGVASAVTVATLATTQTAAIAPVYLTHHDATGRVQTAQATLNDFRYNGVNLSVTYTSDDLFCSAFGGTP